MSEQDLPKVKKVTLSEIYHSQKRIETALFGDKDAQIKGHFEIVADHSKYIEKDKRFKYGVAGIVAFLTIFGREVWQLIFHSK